MEIPLTLLWLLLVTYGLINFFNGSEVIGITGNRNWMAISLVSTIPWSIHIFYKLSGSMTKNKKIRLLTSTSFVLIPSIFLQYHCRSRAAMLALLFYLLLLFLNNIPKIGKKAGAAILLFAIGLILQLNNHVDWNVKEDIRLPTWLSTARLIRKILQLGRTRKFYPLACTISGRNNL